MRPKVLQRGLSASGECGGTGCPAGRLLLGRPWRIQASTIGHPRMTREIEAKGLRGSREAIDELAAEIASGR